jgi:AraC-like DNA-binding protein
MYSYLYLSLLILGLFTIFENLKGGQKMSLMKLNFILLLVSTSLASALDFSNEIGYNLDFYGAILRVISTILIFNLFHLVSYNKLTKTFIILEFAIFIIYLIAILGGYRFMVVHEGRYLYEINSFSIFNTLIVNPLFIISMAYNLFKVVKSSDNNNLYQVKIKRWIILLFIFFTIVFLTVFLTSFLYLKQIIIKQFDTRWLYITYRFVLILFIFLRPRFIDEVGVSFIKFSPMVKKGQISVQNFEFLFYINQYFIKNDANLEDFASILNHNKAEVSDFIKKQTGYNFSELINKNRITYFKELLRTKQHESFKIEALSEMSGFNNRQSMYNAFNKYEGCSPSEFINNL